jgi:hypothetical protein
MNLWKCEPDPEPTSLSLLLIVIVFDMSGAILSKEPGE